MTLTCRIGHGVIRMEGVGVVLIWMASHLKHQTPYMQRKKEEK